LPTASSPSADAWLAGVLTTPAPAPAQSVADALGERYPGAAIFLYGSGISVSAHEDPTAILFDYYVIAPDYRSAIEGALERLAAVILPPNVYYVEVDTAFGKLRAKYALLSVAAFERLVSMATFHSYFWARFAQPSRLVRCPEALRLRMIEAVKTASRTFLRRAQGLAEAPHDWKAVWLAGLNASYKAELRAEATGRAAQLIEHYGEWPQRIAKIALASDSVSRAARLAWRARAVQGAFLSVARLLKATTTFKGGIDYIAWKVKRHAGVDVGVKPWERKHPFFAAPIVALRYYRLRAEKKRASAP
jgi:hypothetical protein